MEIKFLSDIATNITSGLTPLRNNLEFWKTGTIPWLKTEQLGEKHIYETNEYITEIARVRTNIKIYPPNTLTIAMYGEGKTRGNISIIKKPMATNQACCNIEIDNKKADFEYVYYYLKTQYNLLRNLSSGIRKNLNSNDIKNYPIRLPESILEQKKIAAVLSALDAKIELNHRINKELEALAKLLYDYWFVQFDFPGKNGKPYKTSGGRMVWSEVLKREIPAGWEVGSLKTMGDICGGSTPTRKEEAFFAADGFPWITPKDLANNRDRKFIARGEVGVTNAGIKDASLQILPKGTVLLTSRAPVGYTAIALNEVTTNQGFKSFIPKNGFSSSYIYYTINLIMKTIIQNASGSTFKEIPGATLEKIKFYFAPTSLIAQFTEKVEAIFAKQINLETESQSLANLRDFLLPLLMNGQAVV